MDKEISDIKVPKLVLPDGELFNLFDNEKEGDRIIII